MKRILPLFLALAWALPSDTSAAPKPPATFTGVLSWTATLDADTANVKRDDGKTVKVRAFAIDAPETAKPRQPGQPGATEALAYAKEHWQGKRVTLTIKGDSYGRPVVQIDGNAYALDLLSHGHAWLDTRYSKNKELVAAQAKAKADKVGLWAQPAIPPWEFRKQQRVIERQPRRIFNRRK